MVIMVVLETLDVWSNALSCIIKTRRYSIFGQASFLSLFNFATEYLVHVFIIRIKLPLYPQNSTCFTYVRLATVASYAQNMM